MEIKQKMQLKRHLVPELAQSLNILALPLQDIKELAEKELEDNPFLEEVAPKNTSPSSLSKPSNLGSKGLDLNLGMVTKKAGLQEILLRQLGMFTESDEEFRVGEEIIGNIDENGYLKATPEELNASLKTTPEELDRALKLIQQFEPPGVGARTPAECLLIQLRLANETDPLLAKIVESHLEDVAKKNYSLIAKSLGITQEALEPLIKMILRLDPKPGRNYSAEETRQVIPDIQIDLEEKADEEETENEIVGQNLKITINNEDIPDLQISETYKEMLQQEGLDAQAKVYLEAKFQKAVELLRAISRRQATLRSIVTVVSEIQKDAIKEDFSYLKPLTFAEVAARLDIHESTVSRAVMNKYVKTPNGVVALRDFFTSSLKNQSGESISSNYAKKLIVGLIEKEDKKHPLSDQEISQVILKNHGLNISRRTVAKYREELKVLSTSYRRER